MALFAERCLEQVREILVAYVGAGNHAEFVAAQPHGCDRPRCASSLEFLRQTLKQRVTGAVAVRVVVVLEAVEVGQPQHEALRRRDTLLDVLDQRPAVGQARQSIGPRITVVLLKRRARRRLPTPAIGAQEPKAQAHAEQARRDENDRHGAS